jgi:hypothetical protein
MLLVQDNDTILTLCAFANTVVRYHNYLYCKRAARCYHNHDICHSCGVAGHRGKECTAYSYTSGGFTPDSYTGNGHTGAASDAIGSVSIEQQPVAATAAAATSAAPAVIAAAVVVPLPAEPLLIAKTLQNDDHSVDELTTLASTALSIAK